MDLSKGWFPLEKVIRHVEEGPVEVEVIAAVDANGIAHNALLEIGLYKAGRRENLDEAVDLLQRLERMSDWKKSRRVEMGEDDGPE